MSQIEPSDYILSILPDPNNPDLNYFDRHTVEKGMIHHDYDGTVTKYTYDPQIGRWVGEPYVEPPTEPRDWSTHSTLVLIRNVQIIVVAATVVAIGLIVAALWSTS